MSDVVDACVHNITTAFCATCRAHTRTGETVKRQRRESNATAWETTDPLPFPHTAAAYRSLCPSCDEYCEPGTEIYLVESQWLDYQCAHDAFLLGANDGGKSG